MDFGFISNLPQFGLRSRVDLGSKSKPIDYTVERQTKRQFAFDLKSWACSILSIVPWGINGRDKMQMPPTINWELRKQTRASGVVESSANSRLFFRPYVSKVPWHKGPRAFLSQLFPRYGHYCGPNWSSGKDNGSPLWDKRPIDWLDFCCYCHDIGYDTHDQSELLKADLAFLECLERPHMSMKGDAHVAHIYKTMSIAGLKNILIPYRKHLVGLQSQQPLIAFGWLCNLIGKK
ncbi:uncharacterized protein LOC122092813 [Macadamia integrifolia]|uniref:uncharacterized protein LOC122092813 n=1 Tax=Macadamia integrifolia TaxID=60698 RepID=UPI001C527F25|nr:uncharacterized protein LOC122092813 [Macadamia integrifolia]